MRFVRYQTEDQKVRTGVAVGEKLIPLERLTDVFVDNNADPWDAMHTVSQLSAQTLQSVQPESGSVRVLAPVGRPGKVICVGLNYRDHAIETGSPIPTEPIIFSKFPEAVIGPEAAIELPTVCEKVDYEAELVVVIGRSCRYVGVDNAMEYVFGYACGHDVSARDWQKGKPGGQWLLGKSFDTFAPLGPYLVHRDAIPDPGNLRVQFRLNGVTLQDSTTSQLIFSIPEVIAYVSQVTTLRAGDLIYTGTPPGVGDARQPPRYLKNGDLCEVEIDGLGILRNPCTSGDQP